MTTESYFCPGCRKTVQYRTRDAIETADLQGVPHSYSSTIAYCNTCNERLAIPDIEDMNLQSLYDVYRAANAIISLADIRSIPTQYSVDNRSLSLLLGWDERTFDRYYSGDMPSKHNSSILKRLLEDPDYYHELLEADKHSQ